MQYPLSERIGDPELLVGREKEFALFNKWLKGIPKRISKSRVILARRKSGKTALVQRIFNNLWSANKEVIPFYYNFPEKNIWYPNMAIEYYRTFASHYISFLERDETLVKNPLQLKEIRDYGLTKSIKPFVSDVDSLLEDEKKGNYDLMWHTASAAPHRFAGVFDKRILVILDELQNISAYVFRDQECTNIDKTLAGIWHEYSESKIAPMLVTGSYVGWMLELISTYFEGGRLKITKFSPYLAYEEGIQAVYRYAGFYEEPVTNESAIMINQLCMSDPFFISCVIGSDFEGKELTTKQGVIDTVHYEITDRKSEMSKTWGEYIELTLTRVNDIHAKNILLHLSKHSDREWTPDELKQALNMELSTKEIHERLRILVSADVIGEGISDIDYQGLKDGTLNLILQSRFKKEISTFKPDIKKDFSEKLTALEKEKKSLQGKLNNLVGKFAEFQLMTDFRTRKRFPLSVYFKGVADTEELNIIDTKMRMKFQRDDGKEMEIDVLAESDCNRVVLAEVKKTKDPTGLKPVQDFQEKVSIWSTLFPDKKPLPVFLSVGGFTAEALEFCREQEIGTAEQIAYFFS
ncbi:hypothetical protein QUF70_14805 [Desulfobacterales bacterium HSG17]|nr:hypothetical protein [Desulfobacterales bacterium HSG17]